MEYGAAGHQFARSDHRGYPRGIRHRPEQGMLDFYFSIFGIGRASAPVGYGLQAPLEATAHPLRVVANPLFPAP